MSEPAVAGAPAAPGPASLRWIAAALVAGVFVEAAARAPRESGLSTFGDPPQLALAWLACAGGWASVIARARDRLAVARHLVLALVVTTLFGRHLVGADGGLRLALLGLTLGAAAPWLRRRPGAAAAVAALLLALPALLLGGFPQGALLWIEHTLPVAALALLLPAVLPGGGAARAATAFVLATGAGCAAALVTYPVLARGLALPLSAVLPTRLHVLGLHPNLAVPHLVTALVVGVTLLPRAGRVLRVLLAAALAATALALAAVQSRTGLLAAGFGVALLVLALVPGRVSLVLHRLAVLGVAVLLLLPLTELSSGTVTRHSTSMVSKAVSFRSAMWELGRDTLQQTPWHGFGPGTAYVQGRFARASRYDGLPKDDHPHNVLLAGGEALGWPGLLGLALLFVAGVRRPRAGGALAQAATAAALALWAADAIDMGGADATLYPSLAFVLLGLRQAAALPDDPGRGAAAGSVRRTALVAGLLLALFGLASFAGRTAERAAVAHLDAATLEPVERELRWAAALQPFSPNVRLQEARLAKQRGDQAGAVVALEQACALYPGHPDLTHQLALALAADEPADLRVDALLAAAIAADPHGDGAWRRLRDRAQVRALLGDAGGARDALVGAVLLNPAAVAGLPAEGEGEALVLRPGGPRGAAVPLAELLAALTTRRAELAAVDPASETRLRMREVEVLRALQQWDRAQAAARELVSGERIYLARQLAQSALERGEPEEAVARLREVGTQGHFWVATDLVEALSRASPPEPDAFRSAVDEALAILGRDVDVIFESAMVQRLLEARRRWAERQQDAVSALRFADAVEFAAR